MNLTTNTKILRKVLILCVLAIGLMFVASNEAVPVSAKTCQDANNDFYSALTDFDTAFNAYHYDSPGLCATQCSTLPIPSQAHTTCLTTCRNTYRGAVSDAQIGIFQAGDDINTCTNPSPDPCALAHSRNNQCSASYGTRL